MIVRSRWFVVEFISNCTSSWNIPTYGALKTLVVDIETAGINPRENRIYAIGCMREIGEIAIFFLAQTLNSLVA